MILVYFSFKQDTAWCLDLSSEFLFRHFKEEDIFYLLQDHQCIEALPLGLKMPMVPTQHNLERRQQNS